MESEQVLGIRNLEDITDLSNLEYFIHLWYTFLLFVKKVSLFHHSGHKDTCFIVLLVRV